MLSDWRTQSKSCGNRASGIGIKAEDREIKSKTVWFVIKFDYFRTVHYGERKLALILV